MDDTLEAVRDLSILAELWGISSSLDRLREEQWLAASRIVASLESVEEAVERLRSSVERQTRVLERGFQSLEAALDFQTHMLDRLWEAVREPEVAKQARWLREHGERALREGQYDDAHEYFVKSLELNPFDYGGHWTVAVVRLEHSRDAEGAWNSCEMALRHGRIAEKGTTEQYLAAFYSSRALCLMGRMLEAGGLLEDALEYYRAACTASPTYGECFHRYASAAARLGNSEQAVLAAQAALLVAEAEAVLMTQDPEMAFMKSDLEGLVTSMREEEGKVVSALAPTARVAVSLYKDVATILQADPFLGFSTTLGQGQHEEVARLAAWDDYVGSAVARGTELASRGGWVELKGASQYLWEAGERSLDLVEGLSEHGGAAAEQLCREADERLSDTRKWAADKAGFPSLAGESLSENMKGGGDAGCFMMGACILFGLIGLGLLAGAAYSAYSGYDEDVNAVDAKAAAIMAAVGGGFLGLALLPLLGALIVGLVKAPFAKLGVRPHLRKAEQEHAAIAGTVQELQGLLAWTGEVTGRLAASAQLIDRDDVLCSVVLLEPGARSKGYNERRLADYLQEVAEVHGQPVSQVEVINIIHGTPAVFLRGLRTTQAWTVASHLRGEWRASAAIVREYVGEFRWMGTASPV
jgi:tetratricopeptide (TPR) repeat protein